MTPANQAPSCEGCCSFGETTIGSGRNAIKAIGCSHIMVAQHCIVRARSERGDCGPAAKYYEPRESKDE